jgi:DNA replication licensing factor MCM4
MQLNQAHLFYQDGGLCCIDEFDKVGQDVQSVLHEVMKTRPLVSPNVRLFPPFPRSVGTANPVHSRHDNGRSMTSNINLPHSLLSRSDMIFVMLDTVSDRSDTALAHDHVKLYRGRQGERAFQRSPEFLKKYVAYAKANCCPQLSDQARDLLEPTYVKMRQSRSMSNSHVIAVTVRTLQSLLRFSIQHMLENNLLTIDTYGTCGERRQTR